jgi:hypothetical protein
MGATDIEDECATPSSLRSYGGEESSAPDSFESKSFEVESGPPHHDHANETMKRLELIKKCLLSKKLQKDMHGLHDILHVVHTYVILLMREVSTLREEVNRQKQAAEIAVMEKECELRMVQSEAAALKVETSSRAAVASVLERWY